ncbi:MAG TPA: hypothetical protein VKR56_02840 [Candidatus Cybelea sp.]|nr:hypothetical protein [Candidatus Cybelea sp.]
MKNFSLALGVAALVAVLAGCSGGGGSTSQLPTTGSGLNPGVRNARWFTYYFTSPSSIAKHAAVTVYGQTSFAFKPSTYTALLVTADQTLTGDLTTKTLTDAVSVSGGKKAHYDFTGSYGSPSSYACNDNDLPPNVRFFINSGSPIFNFTRYWWSNPVSWDLAGPSGNGTTLTQLVNDPADWSDWAGHPGNYDPGTMRRFLGAIKHVRYVGLSFGCGFGFENGVTVKTGRTVFNSTFTE